MSETINKKANKLIDEKSPYLLQHAFNPVDWYPWSKEAFDKAKKENKPIFLSIGYSTCHWCHVMEHQSFEDEEVAKVLNDDFISIKVDREERPDVDNVYMTVCQMLTGSGGWPLTIIMTPDKEPFFAGTYFPKNSVHGRIGMLDLIPRISDIWRNKKEEAIDSAVNIVKHLAKYAEVSKASVSISEDVLHNAFEMFNQRFDDKQGGFGNSPKFPSPHNLLFLLRYWKKTKNNRALSMVEKTLSSMSLGGIYDHLGYGFHRYSTDSDWLVPHFEKMLYDQAMLIMAYAEAYQITKKDEYKKVTEETIAYVLRDMRSKEGGFYCAEDADSEGVEGKFYVWTEEEVDKILSVEEAKLFKKVFNVKKEGNFLDEATRQKNKSNILYLKELLKFDPKIETIKKKLFEVREKRVHPYKDDKVLTNWNGLMISALAKASQVFDSQDYAHSAEQAVEFVLSKMTKDGKLLHRYRDGQSDINGYVDDYAFFICGLLELYEATFNVKYLELALDFNEKLIKDFWDEKNGGFYFTAKDSEKLIIRQKEVYDGAIPSGNSICLLVLLKLAKITGDTKCQDYADKLMKTFAESIIHAPIAYSQFLVALDFYFSSSEIVIAGDLSAHDTKEMISALRNEYFPNKVVLLNSGDSSLKKISSLVDGKNSIGGKSTAYVCKNYSCKKPTTDISEMLACLKLF